jgi:hypothetical protein
MRSPGIVRLEPILIGVPDLSIERRDELVQECLSDNAVVRLDRNEIPNWHRAQRKATGSNEPEPDENQGDSDTESDEDIKFIGTILRS